MAVVELTEKEQIAALLRRNARARVYELGDLDDFDWPHTRWLGWEDEGGCLQELVLLYTEPEVPVLLAIGAEPLDAMTALVREIRAELPATLDVHVTPPLLETLAERFAVATATPHLKLALGRSDLLRAHAVAVDVLEPADRAEVEAFYHASYPGTWFGPRMLATGRYVGVRQGGRLVCVAGVHVYSPAFGVAALGNVATLPERREEGFARSACAALCLLLLEDGIETVALNVRADNVPALAAYEKLGFEVVTEYVEASLVAH